MDYYNVNVKQTTKPDDPCKICLIKPLCIEEDQLFCKDFDKHKHLLFKYKIYRNDRLMKYLMIIPFLCLLGVFLSEH